MFPWSQKLQLQWVIWVPLRGPLSSLFLFLLIGLTHMGVMDPRPNAINLKSSGGNQNDQVRAFPSLFQSVGSVPLYPYPIPWDDAMFRVQCVLCLIQGTHYGPDFTLDVL
jgi:hypothetical protein